jgi:hypothetical protein
MDFQQLGDGWSTIVFGGADLSILDKDNLDLVLGLSMVEIFHTNNRMFLKNNQKPCHSVRNIWFQVCFENT